MRRMSAIFGLLLGFLVAAVPLQVVSAAPPAGYAAQDRQEAADERLLEAAIADFARTGFPGLARHVPKLEAMLHRAPPVYPKREVRGDLVIVRTPGGLDSTLTALLQETGSGPKIGRAEARTNVYPTAAFYVGSYYIETERPDLASAALDRGLRLQPHEAMLVNEKAVSLVQRRRLDEALALVDSAFASDDPSVEAHRPLLLRRKGFILVELARLDQAEAAYKEALALEPDNVGVKRELAYIAKLHAGQPPTPFETITSDKYRVLPTTP